MPHAIANGVNLHYEIVGPAGAPVVVFAHSIGATMAMWDAQVAALSGRYRCLRYDTRGHGGSEVVAAPATVDDLADDLAGLLDALGIARAHVVGLSLGGMTGQAFALRHPRRLDRLALLATSAEMDAAAWRKRIETVTSEGYEPFIDGIMVPRWFTPAFATAHPEVIAGFRSRMMANDPLGYAACAHVIATLDLLPRISGIKAPTMIIVGAGGPRHARRDVGGDPQPRPACRDGRHPGRSPHRRGRSRRARDGASRRLPVARRAAGGATWRRYLRRRPRQPHDAARGDYVAGALARAGDFGAPWQAFMTRIAWGDVWGDPALPWKTRSLLTIAMMAALHREEEFKVHFRAARHNGIGDDELRATLAQAGIYAGVPAANAAFRWAGEVIAEAGR